MGKKSWIDPTDIAVELLSRADVLEGAAKRIGAAVRAFVLWLGDEAYTPRTGEAPIVAPSRSGTWSGIVLVHQNRAVSWLLLRNDDVIGDQNAVEPAASMDGIDEFDLAGDVLFGPMSGPSRPI